MLSDSESELFITQSSFSGGTSIELSENNFESLFASPDNEQAVDNFNLRTEDLLTDLSTDKENSCRGITTVADNVFRRGIIKNTTKHKEVNYMK